MAPADLTSELRRAAEQTAQAILDEARAEAARVLDAADRRIAEDKREALRKMEQAERVGTRAAIAAARHRSIESLLEARAGLIARVLERAASLLDEAARSDAYRAQLPAYLEAALRFTREGQPVVVRCAPDLTDACRAAVVEREGVRVQSDDAVRGGFVVQSEDGALRVDGQLRRWLEEARADLAIAVRRRMERDDRG